MSAFAGRRRISRIELDRMKERTDGLRRTLDFSRPRPAAVSELDLSLLDFWYSITDDDTLHVNGGKVPKLGSNITVAAADVSCLGEDTGALYVYLEVILADSTAAIVAVAVSTEPVSELGIMRKVLYQLHKTDGKIVIDAIRITDPWLLPLLAE